MIGTLRHVGAALAVVLACTGCTLLSAEPDPTRFAVLAALDELPADLVGAPPAGNAAAGLVVGLGPVEVAEYLRRPEVQTRVEGTRLVPSGTELWGEPIDHGLARVLSIGLTRALGAQRIVMHPWYSTEKPDAQVRIAFARFERLGPEKVVLRATWSIHHGTAAVVERETQLERATAGADGASAALALSLALADLVREIAAAWPAAPANGG